jgi:hypothetical protein
MVTSFDEITSDADLAATLAELYGDVNNIDPLIGALAEDHLPGASVGPLAAAGLAWQFTRLRDGDRFWYEDDSAFTFEDLAALRATRLSDIIRRNTGITNLQDNVFFAPALGDINGSGKFDSADIDLLGSEVAGGRHHHQLDLTGDHQLGSADVDRFLTLAGSWRGDADLNGSVEFSDYVVLADHFSQPGAWSQGDFDTNGVVEFPDFVILANNFGQSSATAAVPEPAGLVLLLVGLAFFPTKRRLRTASCGRWQRPPR